VEMKSSYILAATFLFASNASAFTLLGATTEVRGWSDDEILFHLNPTDCPDNIASLLAKARAVWNSVPTSRLTMSVGTETNTTIDEINNASATEVPAILCVMDMAGSNLDGSLIPAIAFGQNVDENGVLNYGAIAINVDESTSQSLTLMPEGTAIAVLAHEMGHILGLGHSTESKALMHQDVTKRKSATLHQDDSDGLSYLYPRHESAGDGLMGGCTIGTRTHAAPMDALWLVMLLVPMISLIPGLIRRRHQYGTIPSAK